MPFQRYGRDKPELSRDVSIEYRVCGFRLSFAGDYEILEYRANEIKKGLEENLPFAKSAASITSQPTVSSKNQSWASLFKDKEPHA